ncbi:ketoacyl-ACP synthase III [Bacteroidales bacterium OttesenSCG-928-M06]|nr:ketoacyl-ACP synthase III [Bacteroidales bacterium OttesenSCG-928-M06]
MAFFSIRNVDIKGFSCCVPNNQKFNNDLNVLSQEEKDKLIATTGINARYVSSASTCTSDLCITAADKLIEDLKWDKEDIDILIFVTQTPDYILPATSCIIQERLGLKKSCYALDVSLGCSGWVYGLSVLSSLMSCGQIKKGLLLAGDTISKLCSPLDKSTYPLFGDAGTCTAVEFSEGKEGLKFHTETDGSGANAIIIPQGGYRNPFDQNSLNNEVISEGIIRNPLNLVLEGMDVFTFGITRAPESVNKLIEQFGINRDDIDFYVFHQANKFMNEKIRKKLKISEEKVPYSLRDFGNTSCASIPLTIVTELKDLLKESSKEIIACGFGVGLSWGSVHFTVDNVTCSDLIKI